MDIEKAKNVLKELKENKYGELLNCYDQGEEAEKAIETVLNELDKDNNIISDLQNEVTLKQCELDNKDKENAILRQGLEENTQEIDKKDKIINKAVDIIENYQICDYEITDYRYRKCEYIADDETPPCKECIREYLESED